MKLEIMSTINSRNIILNLIDSRGYYEDDPRVAQIVEYTTLEGNKAYGVTWINEPIERQHRYEIETEYVRNPRIVWRATDVN